MRSQAPVEVLSSGLVHGMQRSPSGQSSCASSTVCGLLATSGMHLDRHAPGSEPSDEVQDCGT